MADITMPQLGETVTEGTITKWFKQVGDKIDRDEPLFEVSTDKVDSEVPSSAGGYLAEILVQEVVAFSRERLGVQTVEEFETVKEDVSFPLPQELKSLLPVRTS